MCVCVRERERERERERQTDRQTDRQTKPDKNNRSWCTDKSREGSDSGDKPEEARGDRIWQVVAPEDSESLGWTRAGGTG